MTKPDRFDDLARHVRDQQAWDTDAAWARLHARVQEHRPRRKSWLMAAILVIAFGAGLLSRIYLTSDDRREAQSVQQYTTHVGQHITVQLADGSSVDLAPRSELRVMRFDRTGRNVILNGQAFFNVARDAQRAFQVSTHNATVKVLGTSFEVKGFQGEAVQVAVATGRVQVNNTLVTPGQLAIAQQGEVRVRLANVQELTAWRTGQLVFSNTRFSDVAATLERWHDVDIEIPNPTLANARVSAVFAKQSIDEIVQVLAETLDARVTRDGSRIKFQPK